MDTLQWYPGHMAKTKREMQDSMRFVDVVVEVVDARVAQSSRNPFLDELWSQKPRVIVLNKADMADPSITASFVKSFENAGLVALPLDSLHTSARQKAATSVLAAAYRAAHEKIEKDARKGLTRPLRLMIVGIPNTGKSTLINLLTGRKEAAKTGNKPGVTKNLNWIKVPDALCKPAGGLKVELLDTPGILWPKFDDQSIAQKLAFIGSIGDTVLDEYSLAIQLAELLYKVQRHILTGRYGLTEEEIAASKGDGHALLERIAHQRGHLKAGGVLDTERTATMLLTELRCGKIGRVSLEKPTIA